ncbi:hypothetical protein AYI70_g1159 [Smittium culicis]|uniref:Uncharacterized protein n=1 Tax=Smittium culicis TaxID=133412 RepID=A0A1R1YED3_9FUNG|nr:hypothetical protein AYI70_g1159 [Smittium culicis]
MPFRRLQQSTTCKDRNNSYTVKVQNTAAATTAEAIPRPVIRAITEPVDLHEDPPLSSRVGQVERNSSLGISRRPADYGGIQIRVPNIHALNLLQDLGACIEVQIRKVVDYAVSVDHTPCNGDQNQRNFPQSSVHQDPGSPLQSQQISQRWPNDIEMSGELIVKAQ